MMRWIVGSSLKLRRVVVVAAAGLMLAGFMQVGSTKVDTLPEFAQPTVEVQTEALGLSAVEVEQLITVPLEQDLLNGIAFLETIRSESVPSLSSIELVFEPGTDLLRARQLVQERLTEAHALPNVSKPSTMLQPVSSNRRVMMIGMSSEELSLIEMSLLARWTIKPRLQGVEGVANVAVWGQRERQLQVRVDPRHLRRSGVTLQEIIDSTGNALWVSPLTFLEASTPGTGGFIDTPNQRLLIQHLLPVKTAKDLARVAVTTREGRSSYVLGDVANVVEDHQPLIGDAALPQGSGLLMVVEKFPGADTLAVTRAIEDALEGLKPGLSDVVFDTSLYRPASYLERSIDNVALGLIIGTILLLLLFGALLYDRRSALVAAASMATSAAVALLVLRMADVTANAVVIAGLGLALVAVIDEAVVGVETIMRRLRERAVGDRSRALIIDLLHATVETRGALLFATIAVALATLPLLFLTGPAGAFFPAMAQAYLLAVGAAMLVALTLTPALGMMVLANAPLEREEPPLVRWLQKASDRAITPTIARPGRVFVAVGVLAVISLAMVPLIRRGPALPTLKEPVVLVGVDAAPGTSLPEMHRIVDRAGAEIRAIPGVSEVGIHVGRAVNSDRVVGVNTADLWVAMDPSDDYTATLDALRGVAAGFPGLDMDVMVYSNDRVIDLLSGVEHDVVIRVLGEDLDVLTTKAQEVQRMLSGIEGIEQPLADVPLQEPTLEVEVDLDAARRIGIRPGDVRRAAATLLSGLEVGQLFDENKIFEVVVWTSPEIRSSVEAVRALPIDTPDGGQVPLARVANVRISPNPSVVTREAVSRSIEVTADVRGRALGAVLADVEAGLETIEFPLDHHARLIDSAATRQADSRRALLAALAAAIGVLLLLQAVFGRWHLAVLLFLTLPVAFSGALVAAAAFGDRTASLATIGALFAVLLVTMRHGILLFKRYRTLERRGEDALGEGMILQGARERFVPTMRTMLGLVAMLLPLLVLGPRAGAEMLHPMAVAMLGGLLTSTVVTAYCLPSLYLRFRGDPSVRTVDDDVDLVRARVLVLDEEERFAGTGFAPGTAEQPMKG